MPNDSVENPNNGHNSSDRLDRVEETLDRVSRGLEHLLNNQVEHREHLARHDRLITHLLDTQDDLKETTRELSKHYVLFTDETSKAFAKVAEASRHADERVAEMSDRMAEMSGKLNALIAVVDGIVRNKGGT